jgi:predicted O-methyltransferase YrrM
VRRDPALDAGVADTLRLIAEVEGWLTPREARLLYTLARGCTGRGVIVEIGAWKGRSTICLARGARDGRRPRVYAVDPHTGSPEHRAGGTVVDTAAEFARNLARAGVADGVASLIQTSEAAARTVNEPVELVFIDGAHEEEAVARDFELWFPKVVAGGVMAFHDSTGWPGVKRVVERRVYRSRRFREVRFVDSITAGRKVDANTLADRLANRRALALKRLCEFGGRLHLPPAVRHRGRALLERLT